MIRKLLLSSVLALCALPALSRENYALLIAASDYDNLKDRFWLKGPKNDAEMVATYLTTEAPVPFADENVTVLTDGVEGRDRATLANIRAAFAALEETVEPGDFVYLHFSGHGTQAPALDPDTELDGLDELFLPVDIGPWNTSVGMVENALVDDEIGQLIDGLRAKGADVWVVFDSCHSGTATRAVESDDYVGMRQLDDEALADLGIPELEYESSRGVGGSEPEQGLLVDMADAAQGAGQDGWGNLIAFYAAQTNEVTPEKNLPKGQPDRKPRGVFTFTLFETLAEYPAATYGQVAQEILRKYSVKNLAKSTPLFEGDLDQVVFGGKKGERVAQWEAAVADGTITIPAGTLHGLSEGDEMAVLTSAAAQSDTAIGYVRVTAIDTFTATLEPVEKDGVTLPAELPKGLYIRKLDTALEFGLTVALPEPGTVPADTLLAAIADLEKVAGPRLNFVAAGQEADLQLAVLPDVLDNREKTVNPHPDAIWILPGTGLAEDLSQTPRVDTAGQSPDTIVTTLADKLAGMAKALNLMKVGGVVGSDSLNVEVEMLTKSPTETVLRALPGAPVPTLAPDDQVHVLARNNMDVPVDVNVLYIGADYSITHWFAGRLNPGNELKKGLFKITDSSLGQERMIVVVTPAEQHTKVEDLSYLAQEGLTRSIDEFGGLEGVLANAGFGETTRGAMALDDESGATGPAPMILQLEVRTAARE